MSNLKAIAAAVLLTLGFSGLAVAGANLRQDDDGGASWIVTYAGTDYTYSVGRNVVDVYIADVSTAGSVYVPIYEDAYLTGVYCALQTAISGADATIAVARNAQAALTTITVTQSGSGAGDVDSSTGLSTEFFAGDTLVIGTNGQSSTTAVEHCVAIFDSNP